MIAGDSLSVFVTSRHRVGELTYLLLSASISRMPGVARVTPSA